MTEEMKNFLQEGLAHYAPACVALSEFRRQIRSKLQAVLDDFSAEFTAIGLDVANSKPTSFKLDDEGINEKEATIGIRNNQGGGLENGCYVGWNLTEPHGKQFWASIWIYVGKKSDRDRLFTAMDRHRSPVSEARWEVSAGYATLFVYLNGAVFYEFEVPFRSLVQEWVELLSAAGGIRMIGGEQV